MIIYPYFNNKGQTNSYIVVCEKTNEGFLIDCPEVTTTLIDLIESKKIKLLGVILTHAHLNHSEGILKLLKIYNIPIYAYLNRVLGVDTICLKDVETLTISSFTLDIYNIPGHSPDSIVIKINNSLFTGDVISAGRVGITKNNRLRSLLISNINKKIMSLDDHVLIYPAHGAISKIRVERMFNHDLLQSEAAQV